MRTRPVLVVVLSVFLFVLTAGVLLAGQARPRPQVPTPVAPRDGAGAPRSGTGALKGSVAAADSGRPVRRASVILASPEIGFRQMVSSDEMGNFSFAQVPPGLFTLSATRPGYLDVSFGERTPGSGRPGTGIQLAAGQRLENISLKMPRTGILTGVITDEFGDPAMGVQVRAWRYVRRSGERTLVSAGGATTDDRGIYRISGLVPGEYVVGTGARETSETMMVEMVKAREAMAFERAVLIDRMAPAPYAYTVPAIAGARAPASGYAAVFYPGTVQASAAASVTLGISEERGGVDMQLQVVPFARISGSVIGPDGGVPTGVDLRLIDSATSPAARTYSAQVRPDGSFSIVGVPPGQYTLVARTGAKGEWRVVTSEMTVESRTVRIDLDAPLDQTAALKKELDGQRGSPPGALWARLDLAVDGQPLTDIVVSLQRGLEVSGSFDFDGTPPQPPDLARIRVQLTPASTTGVDAGAPSAPGVYTAGRFTVRGVTPGQYRLNASGLPSGWTLKSAVFNGSDVLDGTLDVKPGDELSGGIVTFTNQSTELSGTLQDQAGKPVADYTIVVFSADRRFWTPNSRRIQAARPATDGRFSFRNLPAGDYRLIAVIDPEPGEWFNPSFLDQLVGATMPIAIGNGERKVQDVRIAR